eukprot:661093_1
MMYSLLIAIWIMRVLIVYGDDNDTEATESLCDCYSISLQSISGVSVDNSICYTYSILHSRNDICQTDAIGMILGVCDAENEIQFTDETLQESITSIQPEQAVSTSHPTDSFLGIQVQMSGEVTLCMKNINHVGATSHNVQYISSNNDVITCRDTSQHGLPCKASKATSIETQENVHYVAEYVEIQDGVERGEYERVDTQQTVMGMDHASAETTHSGTIDPDKGYVVITPHSGLLIKELHKGLDESQDEQLQASSTVRIAPVQYEAFALIASMIFIGLNLIFCVYVAVRKSDTLESVPDSIDEREHGGSVMFNVNNIDEDNPSDYISDIAQISKCIMDDIIAPRNHDEDDNGNVDAIAVAYQE